jgi:Cu/Ag efflux protein CusF
MKRLAPVLAVCLMAATAAHAQFGGGGGGGGHRGGGKHSSPNPSAPSPSNAAPTPAPKPQGKVEIVGVITAIDPQAERITIAYDAVEALNLPAGTRPFVVSKDALLKDASVGEKVRFSLESQQISDLKPF